MKKVKIKNMSVEIYDNIEELPITRFHKYNKMLLIDSGIGSDLNDFDRHIEKALRYIGTNNNKLAITEIENLRQNVYFIQMGLSPKHLAFAVLVYKINDVICNDMSDEALKEIVKKFSDVPNNEIMNHLEDSKKKIDEEMMMYFPSLFENSEIKEYYDKLRKRTLLILKNIINKDDEKDTLKEIEDITTQLITYFSPNKFSGNGNFEVNYDKQFENMCLMLSKHLHVNAKKMSVLEFYNSFEYIKEEARKMRRSKRYK